MMMYWWPEAAHLTASHHISLYISGWVILFNFCLCSSSWNINVR